MNYRCFASDAHFREVWPNSFSSHLLSLFPNYSENFHSDWIQLNTTILHGVTAYLTLINQLPRNTIYSTPWLDWLSDCQAFDYP